MMVATFDSARELGNLLERVVLIEDEWSFLACCVGSAIARMEFSGLANNAAGGATEWRLVQPLRLAVRGLAPQRGAARRVPEESQRQLASPALTDLGSARTSCGRSAIRYKVSPSATKKDSSTGVSVEGNDTSEIHWGTSSVRAKGSRRGRAPFEARAGVVTLGRMPVHLLVCRVAISSALLAGKAVG